MCLINSQVMFGIETTLRVFLILILVLKKVHIDWLYASLMIAMDMPLKVCRLL